MMKRYWKSTLAMLLCGCGLTLNSGCEVEVDEGPVEDAVEEVVED